MAQPTVFYFMNIDYGMFSAAAVFQMDADMDPQHALREWLTGKGLTMHPGRQLTPKWPGKASVDVSSTEHAFNRVEGARRVTVSVCNGKPEWFGLKG